jgi:sirohydrochlorin cobaltochelatase
VKGKITASLEQWLEEGCRRIGEILILKKNGDFALVHHADGENAAGQEIFTKPEDAREISLYDAAGEYRPLKSAPNLRRGWELRLRTISELHAALDFFYPAMLGLLLSHREGNLKPVHFRETAARQSGMYDVVKKISNAQADALAGDFCKSGGKCIKTILWKLDPGTPLTKLPVNKFDPQADQLGIGGNSTLGEAGGRGRQSLPLLCSEACNLLVAAAREVVRGSRSPQ